LDENRLKKDFGGEEITLNKEVIKDAFMECFNYGQDTLFDSLDGIDQSQLDDEKKIACCINVT
jgi:hypothetical protein